MNMSFLKMMISNNAWERECRFFYCLHQRISLSSSIQAYQRLQIQHQMMQAQRNVSGPIRQQEQQVSQMCHYK